MDKIKLSICIPTYNREHYLRETIDSIVCQLTPDIIDDVELVISDNASIDNTTQLINAYRSKFRNIVYHKSFQNMGADRNYLKVIELANGAYCWFLGSDDNLICGSLKKVLTLIDCEAPDIAISARLESDISLASKPLINRWTTLANGISFHSTLERDKFYHYLESCGSIGGLFSFLSVIVLKKEKWETIPDKERFIGSAYVHVHVLLAMLKEGAYFSYLTEPLVLCRLGNDSFCHDQNDPALLYRRMKLDIDGYREIAAYVFGSDSVEFSLIHGIVDRSIGLNTCVTIDRMLRKTENGKYDKAMERLLLHNCFLLKYLLIKVCRIPLIWKIIRRIQQNL